MDKKQYRNSAERGFAVVLGTGEIASAIGVHLHRMGWSVALSHDPETPVLRRGMAFYDALFGDRVVLDGVGGRHGATSVEIRNILRTSSVVAVTPLDLMNLIVIDQLDVLVDARLRHGQTKPDLRWLAGVSLGIGAGYYSTGNCDIAIGLLPEELGAGHFVHAPLAGYWHTPIEPGMRVYKNLAIGKIGGLTVRAPCDGTVLGILRDGLRATADTKLLDIDPRPRQAQCSGIDRRGHAAGKATAAAVAQHSRAHNSSGIPVRIS